MHQRAHHNVMQHHWLVHEPMVLAERVKLALVARTISFYRSHGYEHHGRSGVASAMKRLALESVYQRANILHINVNRMVSIETAAFDMEPCALLAAALSLRTRAQTRLTGSRTNDNHIPCNSEACPCFKRRTGVPVSRAARAESCSSYEGCRARRQCCI